MIKQMTVKGTAMVLANYEMSSTLSIPKLRVQDELDEMTINLDEVTVITGYRVIMSSGVMVYTSDAGKVAEAIKQNEKEANEQSSLLTAFLKAQQPAPAPKAPVKPAEPVQPVVSEPVKKTPAKPAPLGQSINIPTM